MRGYKIMMDSIDDDYQSLVKYSPEYHMLVEEAKVILAFLRQSMEQDPEVNWSDAVAKEYQKVYREYIDEMQKSIHDFENMNSVCWISQ